MVIVRQRVAKYGQLGRTGNVRILSTPENISVREDLKPQPDSGVADDQSQRGSQIGSLEERKRAGTFSGEFSLQLPPSDGRLLGFS